MGGGDIYGISLKYDDDEKTKMSVGLWCDGIQPYPAQMAAIRIKAAEYLEMSPENVSIVVARHFMSHEIDNEINRRRNEIISDWIDIVLPEEYEADGISIPSPIGGIDGGFWINKISGEPYQYDNGVFYPGLITRVDPADTGINFNKEYEIEPTSIPILESECVSVQGRIKEYDSEHRTITAHKGARKYSPIARDRSDGYTVMTYDQIVNTSGGLKPNDTEYSVYWFIKEGAAHYYVLILNKRLVPESSTLRCTRL